MSDKDDTQPEETPGIEIPQVPENLADLTDAKLTELHGSVLEFITDSEKAVEVLAAHPGNEGKGIMEALFASETAIKSVIDERAEKAAAEADALKMVADKAAAEQKAREDAVAAEAAAKAEAEEAAKAEEAESADQGTESESDVGSEEKVETEPASDGEEVNVEAPVAEEVSGEVDPSEQSDPGDEDAPVADRDAELVAAAVKAALDALGSDEKSDNLPARSDAADPARAEVERIGDVTITASGHAQDIAPGADYDNVNHFLRVLNESGAKALDAKALGRQEIGTMSVEYPDEYTMSATDAEGNARKMRSIAASKITEVLESEDSISAAACGQLCAPSEPIFDNLGLCLPENRSYIEAALPFVFTARGQYNWIGNPIAVDGDGNEVGWDYGVGKCAENCGDDAWSKPCVEIGCPEGESCSITPIPACLKVDTMLSKTWDEGLQVAMSRLMAEFTAYKDQFLLAQIEYWASAAGGGSTVNVASRGGAYGSVPYNFSLILEQYIETHRISRTGCPLHILVPEWLRTSRQLDMLLGMFRCECSANSIGMFDGTDLVARVDFYRHPFPDGAPTVNSGCLEAPKDNPMAAHDWYNYDWADGGDVPCLPDTARIYVLGPVGNIFGQTMGRMSWMNVLSEDDLAQNCYRSMIEDFMGLCKTGGFPVHAVDMGICADGSVTGTIEPACCS